MESATASDRLADLDVMARHESDGSLDGAGCQIVNTNCFGQVPMDELPDRFRQSGTKTIFLLINVKGTLEFKFRRGVGILHPVLSCFCKPFYAIVPGNVAGTKSAIRGFNGQRGPRRLIDTCVHRTEKAEVTFAGILLRRDCFSIRIFG